MQSPIFATPVWWWWRMAYRMITWRLDIPWVCGIRSSCVGKYLHSLLFYFPLSFAPEQGGCGLANRSDEPTSLTAITCQQQVGQVPQHWAILHTYDLAGRMSCPQPPHCPGPVDILQDQSDTCSLSLSPRWHSEGGRLTRIHFCYIIF